LHHFINGRRKGAPEHGRAINKEDDIKYFFDGNLITLDIENALATGNWGRNKDGVIVKTGVA
jgi:DNA-directed RNA polymerase II subunit RPB2